MEDARPRFSVVVPTLNESENIDPLLARLFATLDAEDLSYAFRSDFARRFGIR